LTDLESANLKRETNHYFLAFNNTEKMKAT